MEANHNDWVVDFYFLGGVDGIAIEAALLGGGSPDAADLRDFAALDVEGFLVLSFGNGDRISSGIGFTDAILGDVTFL